MQAPVFKRTIFIGVPATKVWEALTNPQIVNQYYLAPLAKIELEPGGAIYYGSESDRMIDGRITEITVREKLVHTFSFAHRPEDPPSRVIYELKDLGEMTELKLKHDEFPHSNATFADISGGWDVVLSSLKTLLETGETLPWPKPKNAG